MSSADDDFCASGSDTDFAAGIALFGEFAGKKLVEFSEKDAISDKLSRVSDLFSQDRRKQSKKGGELSVSDFNVHRCVHRHLCERSLKQEVPDGRLIIEHKDMYKGKESTFRFFEIGPG